ncbi:MAG TPA: FAD-dependent monooxygenase [Chthoniobacterales bacterium]|nr:FAD-dependent monooxygenase [Chthoniobacterales bacterium]
MSISASFDVLVVGAGPVGLTLACELARNGVTCRIIDKAAAPVSTSRALMVFSRTLEVFQMMGMVEPVLAAGHQLAGIAIYNRSAQIGYIGFGALASRYRFVLSLPQSETERLLTEHLTRFGKSVERERELVGLAESSQGIEAVIRDPRGAEETFKARWVAGCDGARSTVRQLSGLSFEGGAYSEAFVLADLKLDGPIDPIHIHLFLTEARPLGIFPFRNGRFRVIADVEAESEGGSTGEPTYDEIQEIVRRRTDVGIRLSDPVWLSRFHIYHRKIPEFRAGRVFLAGDSAHIHSPAGGQGMNTGIQDVFNLAWKIALVAHGKSPESLLNSYNEEREPVASLVLNLTDRITRVGALHNPIGQQLGNTLLPLVTGMDYVEDRIAETLSEVAIRYRQSSIIADKSGKALRAGGRAPDYEFLRGTDRQAIRLYDLLREPMHHLLVFPDTHGGVASKNVAVEIAQNFNGIVKVFLVECAASADSEDVLLDSDGIAGELYDAEPGAIVLIRPDGYVGFRGNVGHADELSSYLAGIFTG